MYLRNGDLLGIGAKDAFALVMVIVVVGVIASGRSNHSIDQ
jgi:hypothetical protein